MKCNDESHRSISIAAWLTPVLCSPDPRLTSPRTASPERFPEPPTAAENGSVIVIFGQASNPSFNKSFLISPIGNRSYS
jgi:hypothetical protein